MTDAEITRIHEKLAMSRRRRSLEDAMFLEPDDSEGAGLGLTILLLMLRKMGLDEDCFEISAEGGETIAKIIIPLEKTSRFIKNLP